MYGKKIQKWSTTQKEARLATRTSAFVKVPSVSVKM